MRFRIVQTAVVEFDVDPANYSEEDESLTAEQMLEIDLDNFRQSPMLAVMFADEEDGNITLIGTIIEEKN